MQQRFPFMKSAILRMVLAVSAALAVSACGGGNSSSNKPLPASTLTATPLTLSLNHGQVGTITSVSALDANGVAVALPATATYASDNTNVATVDTNGNVCGGRFDSNNIVCNTKDTSGNFLPDGTANITITSGTLKLAIPVAVHTNIDRLQLTTTGVSCTSQGGTQQYTATAFNNNVPVPAANVGQVSFATSDPTVATIDQTGLVTAVKPGAANVNAAVGNVNAVPIAVVTCPPAAIFVHEIGNSNTSFTLAPAGTIQYVVDISDTKGAPITGVTLTALSNSPTTASIDGNELITAVNAGKTSLLVACVPPSCNPNSAISTNGTTAGLPLYSNLVTGTVTGSTSTTVYVTGSANPDGSANTSLIPIDTTTNTAGTAVTLPQTPNSFVFNRQGTAAYLGSANGLMIFGPTTNTVSGTVAAVTGKVLTVSPDGNKVIVSDSSKSSVFVFNVSTSTVESVLTIAGAVAAQYAPDNQKAFIVTGTSVIPYSTGIVRITPIPLAASTVAYLPEASAAFVGGSAITAIATCNNATVNSRAVAVNALSASLLGDHVIGASAANWTDIGVNINGACPPLLFTTQNTPAIAGASGTPSAITITPDSRFAFITGTALAQGQNPSGSLSGYDTVAGTAFATALTGGGQVVSGDITNDSKMLYVGTAGGAAPAVHVIDTSGPAPSDTKQVTTTFVPNLIAVQPK